MQLLDTAKNTNPEAYWWIKGDGCDLVPGLGESVAGEWSGDVDLNTGDLQRSYEQYKSKLAIISGVGLGSRQGRAIVKDDLSTIFTQLRSDKSFIIDGMLYSTLNNAA